MNHSLAERPRRHLRAALCLVAGFLCLAAGVFVQQDANPVVTSAERAAGKISVASAGIYVSLRTLNAFLSTAQEVELGASMVGQASLQPLKALEPVDDTIERVADAVFLVAAASAVAAVAMGPVVSIGLVVLGLGLLGMALNAQSTRMARIAGPACGAGVSFGLVAAFVVPLMFSLGVWVGERATQDRMDDATSQLQAVALQAGTVIGAEDPQSMADMLEEAEGDSSWWGTMRDELGAVFADSAKYVTAGWAILDEADTILAASMTIIGVFILRMVVLPLFLVFGALALLRRVHVPAARDASATAATVPQPPAPRP